MCRLPRLLTHQHWIFQLFVAVAATAVCSLSFKAIDFCHNIGRLVFDYDLLWQQCCADGVRVRIVNTMSFTLDPRLFA
jgi:hypothetical protein